MMSALIDLKFEGAITRITLNRPEKKNALNQVLLGELREALANAISKESRVVVLSGAGQDFCAGADLEAFHSLENATVLNHIERARDLASVLLAMRRHPLPIIAAVRGRALAGGCGLATGCDLIIASETARFGYPEVNIGFVPAMVMAILRRNISEKRAFELIAMGDVISAQRAYEIGLVNHVFPDSDFDSKVTEFAASLAAKSASAISLSKSLLYHMDSMTFDAAIEAGVHGNAVARMTDDARKGIEKFVRKK
jgi:methylglutaconyl-CoA hydratase